MPHHLEAPSSSSLIPRPAHRKPLGPLLNCTGPSVMQRKSRPTCTLALANVSAHRSDASMSDLSAPDAMQIDADTPNVTISFVSVPVSPCIPEKRTKTKGNRFPSRSSKPAHNEINVIPFPTSAQTPVSSIVSTSPPSSTQLSAPHALLRSSAIPLIVNRALLRLSNIPRTRAQIKQLKLEKQAANSKTHEPPFPSSSAPPPRKRARKGSVSAPSQDLGPPNIISKNTGLIDTDIPPRPSSPTPDSRPSANQDAMMIDRPCPPPYSPSPPPYSASPPCSDRPSIITSSPAVIHAPRPMRSPNAVVPPLSDPAPAPIAVPTTPSRIPASVPPPRRLRLPPSEIKLLTALYRTLVVGVERRKRLEESRASLSVRGFLDDMLVDSTSIDALEAYFNAEEDEDVEDAQAVERSKEKDQLAVQDTLLALRLREFLLGACGVEDSLLMVDFDEEENMRDAEVESPFLENGRDGKINQAVDSSPSPSQASYASDPTVLPLPPQRFSSPPPLTASSSSSSRKNFAVSPTHLIAVFTIRSRTRSRHRVPKAKHGVVGHSSLRHELQL